MRCSFCDTDGHNGLRVIVVPNMARISHSPTADRAPAFNTAGACDNCLALIEQTKKSLDAEPQTT